ncbi:MAG: hypothetical protein IJP75_07665 [Bacteroidaceae bacterium]|nr:hypothetical protein [Bacteroidaceae bacterium]
MKTMISRLTFFLLWMVGFSTANAQATLSMENQSFMAGEEKTVAINLDNEVGIKFIQMDIALPAGLEVTAVKGVQDRMGRGQSVQANNNGGGKYRVMLASTNAVGVKGNSGAMFELTIKASGALASTSTIRVFDIEMTAADETPIKPADFSVTVTKEVKLDGTAVFGVETNSYDITPGNTFQVNITLENTAKLCGLEGTLTLPAGLELVNGSDGLFDYSDRIPFDAAFSFPDGASAPTYKFALSSATNTVFGTGSGTFFSFTVKATEALARNTTITLNGLTVADPYANAFDLEDVVTVSVTNLAAIDQTAYEKLSGEIAALQEKLDAAINQVAEQAADVAADFSDDAEAIQEKIDALQSALDAQHAAFALTDESTLDAAAVKAVEDAISTMLTDAAAAQQAYEAAAANKAQNEKDVAAVADAQKALDDAKTAIAGYADEVQAGAAAAITAAQQAIDDAAAAADASFQGGTAVADAEANAAAIAAAKAAAEQVGTDAAAAQQAYEEAQAAAAANKAQNEKDVAAVADAQKALDDAKMAIAEMDDDVQADAAAAIAAAQQAIDDAAAAVDASYQAGTAVADAEANAAAIAAAKAAAEQALADAQAAQWAKAKEPEFSYQKYLVMNVASEKYWGAGNDWGTRASLVPNAEYVKFVPVMKTVGEGDNAQEVWAGTYHLESQVNNGGTQYYFNGDYMDNGNPVELTISRIEEPLGYLDEEETQPYYGYTIANGTNYYGWDGTSTILGKNLAADSENAVWAIVSLEDAKAGLSTATVDDPIDATFLIEDHNFGRNNRYASKWTQTGVNNMSGGNNTNNCAESFQREFNISQELAGAPAGVYELKAQGFFRQDGSDTENLPVIFANDETSLITERTGTENDMSAASAAFSAGKYALDPVFVQVPENGTLTIGAKLEVNTKLWVIFDNFTLTYYGADASVDQVKNAALFAEVAALKAQAEGLVNQVENATVKSALQEAIAGAEGVETADAAEAAKAALTSAVDLGEAQVTAANVLPKMKAFVEANNFVKAGAEEDYYGQWAAKYEAGTLTSEEANALQDPTVVTGWHAAINVDNYLLSAWDTNPDFKDAPYYINTWSIEGESDGSEFKVPFFEYWTGDGNSLGEKTLTGELTDITPGNCLVEAWVRVRIKNGATEAPTGISFKANDGEAINVCDGDKVGESQFYIKKISVPATVGEDGKLTAQFIVAADNNISWLSFQQVNYVAEETQEIEVDGIRYAIKSDNLISNGSFDEGVAGWKTIGYATDAVIDNFTYATEGGFDGGAFITTNGAGVGSEKTLRQSVAVEPGKQYYFTVYTSGKAPDANNFNYNALFQMTDAATENGVLKAFEWPQGAGQTADTWSQTEFVFTASSENPFVGVRMGWNSATSFDGFALYEVEQLSTALEAAQSKAIKALDALAPVGDGIFMYAQSDIEGAKAAVAAATTVEEVEAITMPTPTAPDPEKTYTFQLKLDGETPLYMNLAEAGITIAEEATPMAFVATETEGQYNLVAGEYYVGLAGSDNWTMSTAADNKAAWTFTALSDGTYRINNLVTVGRFVGTNAADKEAGKPCYADKQTSNGNVDWIIEEVVEPKPEIADNTPLTKEMFKGWDGFDASAQVNNEKPYWDAEELGNEIAAGKTVYGSGNVTNTDYANVTGAKTLRINAAEGMQFRVLMNRQADNSLVELNPAVPSGATYVDVDLSSYEYVHINAIKTGWGSAAGVVESLILNPVDEAPEIAEFVGMLEQTLSHPEAGVMGTETTADYKLSVTENGDGTVRIDFASFTLPAPMNTMEVPATYIDGITATADEEGNVAYSKEAFTIGVPRGQMTVTYNGVLEGKKAAGENTTPVFHMVITNATSDDIYFGADQAAIDAYKAELNPEEEDPDLIEIAQEQNIELDPNFPHATLEEGDDYNTYTANEDLTIAFKMLNIDVTGCDYVVVKFAEPVAAGWKLAFWSNQDLTDVPEGATEYKYVFAEDPKCGVTDGVLPQICMMTFFGGFTAPLEAKVTGVYKHMIPSTEEIAIERMVGQGYTAQTEEIDFSAAAAYLGVEEITYDMLRIVNPDDTQISDYAPYDGWFNAEGVAEAWGSNTKICVKFFQAIENGAYQICDMNGADEVGKTYTVKWALTANDKTYFYNFNITFVEYVEPQYKPEIVKTIEIDAIDQAGAAYKDASHPSFDVTEVCAALGIEDITEAKTYIVNVTTGNFVENTTDGWRDANGDAKSWSEATNGYCLKLDNPASGEFNYNGAHDENFAEGDTYVAQWGVVANEKAVLLKVTINFLSEADFTDKMTGIDGIAGGKAKTDGRKYIEAGKVYIFRNGKKVLVSGIQTK